MGVLQGYGAFSFTSRETFLIDPQGTIVYHYDDVNPSAMPAKYWLMWLNYAQK
ncbi:MAG: hypothetical protein U1E99_08265 [Agitococcus sp.]